MKPWILLSIFLGIFYAYSTKAATTAAHILDTEIKAARTIPSHITAQSITPTTIELRWEEVPGAIGYNIYRSDDPKGKFTQRGNSPTVTPATTTHYIDHILLPHSIYSYQINTVSAYGMSATSASITVSAPILPTISTGGILPISSTPLISYTPPITPIPYSAAVPMLSMPISPVPPAPIPALPTPSLSAPLITLPSIPTPLLPATPSPLVSGITPAATLPLPLTLAEIKEPPKNLDQLMHHFQAFIAHNTTPPTPNDSTPPPTAQGLLSPKASEISIPTIPIPDPVVAQALTNHLVLAFTDAKASMSQEKTPQPSYQLFAPPITPPQGFFAPLFTPSTAPPQTPSITLAHELGAMSLQQFMHIPTMAQKIGIPPALIEQKIPEAAVAVHKAMEMAGTITPPALLLAPMSIGLAAIATQNTHLETPLQQQIFI